MVLAYLVSGLIVLPTMFSVAELATALPRSGGTYYIIDRSLGPMFGTIGGVGAYLALFLEVDILYVAVGLTLLLGVLNVVGAKETSLLQKILITALVAIMFFYILQGLLHLFSMDVEEVLDRQFTPFFANGTYGFFATVGMVFVFYAGVTVMVAVLDPMEFREDLTPVATAGEQFLHWLPEPVCSIWR